ncbi:unnamed protein product [Lactuca virosa]|uniref:Uncharacterized protein n=1 Tax=Lactuca virosa TaxID=75947 RepID=A0AAU9MEG1_9ASTR|nr:unnamed protein product [Lactuca virosa]
MNRWFDVNGECCEVFVENGILVAKEDVWKVSIFSPVILLNGGAFGKVSILPALSTVGGVVLLKIFVSCWLCDEEFCSDAVAEGVDPSMNGLHISLIRAVVIVEPPCCGDSRAIVVVC